MPRKWTSTLYGYKVDRDTGTCPIFVTLHKSDEVTASTAYEDTLLDRHTMLWYTRSRRTLTSDEVRAIVDNDVDLHVFVKKDDAEGSDFYYLGQATSSDAEQTTMPGADGAALDVVRMLLRFDQPIESALFDYFHPEITSGWSASIGSAPISRPTTHVPTTTAWPKAAAWPSSTSPAKRGAAGR